MHFSWKFYLKKNVFPSHIYNFKTNVKYQKFFAPLSALQHRYPLIQTHRVFHRKMEYFYSDYFTNEQLLNYVNFIVEVHLYTLRKMSKSLKKDNFVIATLDKHFVIV